MPNAALTEAGVGRAIVELDKATAELRCELTAMKVRRARDAKRRVPRGGLKDCRGRQRSIVTFPGYHSGREPASKGRRYGKTPPSTHEVLGMADLALLDLDLTQRRREVKHPQMGALR